jgi:hypothetical protein
MSSVVKHSKPVSIKKNTAKKEKVIGTCRSYDEEQPVPSFVRSLSDMTTSRRKELKGLLQKSWSLT